MKITLYTIDCPKCKILEKKLNSLNIEFSVCKNTKLMQEKEITLLPVLEVDDKLMNFKDANNWINNMEGNQCK